MSLEEDLWEKYKSKVARRTELMREKGGLGPVAYKKKTKIKKVQTAPVIKAKQTGPVVDAKIDLHGMTQDRAYEGLRSFVEGSSQKGYRLLLVVTGKGREGQSVLKANAPRWCVVPPFTQWVDHIEQADLRHGGEGAFYIVLRGGKTPP